MTHIPEIDPYKDTQDRLGPEHPCLFLETAGKHLKLQAGSKKQNEERTAPAESHVLTLIYSSDRKIHIG